MKVLYLCHRFPYPPKRGGKIRPFNMIRHLARSHDVTVASLVRSREELREGEGLREHCGKVLVEQVGTPLATLRMVGRLPTGRPSSFGYFWSAALDRRVREELAENRYDLIFVHCSSMAPYVSGVRNIPKILDFGDMDSQKWLAYGDFKMFPLSLGYYLEGLKLQLTEARLASEFEVGTCTTKAELRTLDGYNVAMHTDWFPNGVDTERFQPSDRAYQPDTICFVGRMDYFPNQECMFEFCARTLPLIRARRPTVRLVIVGADPSPKVRRLERLEGVTVTGSVPEVQPHVQGSALTVAPLAIARGTQNKILESLAMGVPVVCSPLAAGGVDAAPDEHLLTARTPEEYSAAILRLLDDPTERERLARAGRSRMLSHHNWSNSMNRMDAIIDRCLANFAGA
jgi:sugar transferase (PEP-CTERM/EpsH1 system associated)